MTETELTGAVAGLPEDGPLRARGIHLHVGSQLGAVDAWRDAVRRGPRGPRADRRGTRGLRHVRRRRRVPGRRPGDRADARALRPRGPGAARRAARGPATGAAGRRARPVPRRAGGLARGARAPRPRAGRGRAHRRPRCRHDRADPPGAVRRGPSDRRADLAGPAARRDGLASDGTAIEATDARVDGPICESTDTFDRHRLPPLRRGDLVAIGEAGAYAASMAMTYNGRPAAPQVLLEPDGTLTLGRRRATPRFRSSDTTG